MRFTRIHYKGVWLVAIAAAGVGLLAMLPVVVNGFTTWDDPQTIYENWRISPPSWAGLWAHWSSEHMSLYVPLTYTAWAIVSAMSHAATGQADPGYFHTASLLLHGLTAAVICLWISVMLRARGAGDNARLLALAGAAAGAALFAAHPVQVESVAWASGLKDVLFGLLGVMALWRLAIAQAAWGDAAARRRELILAGVLVMLAMLAKPTAVVLPVMGGAMLWIMGAPWRRGIAVAGVGLLLVFPLAVVAKISQPAHLIIEGGPLWVRPFIALDAYAFYLFKLIWPVDLAVDYGRSPSVVLEAGTLWWSWVIPVALAVMLWVGRRRMPLVAGGFLLAALPVGPVSGLVTFEFQQYSTVADHYLYLPMAGVALAVAGLLVQVGGRPRGRVMAGMAAIVVLLCFMVLDWRQVRQWRSTRTLFTHTVAVNPRSVAGHSSLGSLALEEGRLADALRLTERTLELDPSHVNAQVSRGGALHHLGKTAEAEQAYRDALEASPNDPMALASLGGLLAETGRTGEAEAFLRRAVQVDPELAVAQLNYGTFLAVSGKMDQAERHLRWAMQLKPTDPRAMTNLAIVLLRQGRRDQAINLLVRALQIDPHFAPAKAVLEQNR